jgi:AbiU2
MTAPPGQRYALYRKWGTWIEVVRAEIVRAHLHQDLWTEIRDAVEGRHRTEDMTWLYSYSRVYGDHQMMTIRRVAENSKTTASLGRVLASMRKQPLVMTRTRYMNAMGARRAKKADAASEWDRRFAHTPGDEMVDPAILETDLKYLNDGLKPIIERTHKTIAHLDAQITVAIRGGRRPKLEPVTYGDLRTALEQLGEITNRYLSILRGYETAWTPAIQGDWQAPLRSSLFPNDPTFWQWYPSFT